MSDQAARRRIRAAAALREIADRIERGGPIPSRIMATGETRHDPVLDEVRDFRLRVTSNDADGQPVSTIDFPQVDVAPRTGGLISVDTFADRPAGVDPVRSWSIPPDLELGDTYVVAVVFGRLVANDQGHLYHVRDERIAPSPD